jgi:hypothetical protein
MPKGVWVRNHLLAGAFCMDFIKVIVVFIITTAFPISGLFIHSKSVAIPIATPMPTISATASPAPKNSPIEKSKENINAPTSIPLPSVNATQNTKSDSSMRIELCRANSEQQKMNYIQAGDNLLAQERPQIAELANTSNNQETESIALKYGLIKSSDIVRAADVYQKLINEGNSQDYAKSIADSMANTWWTYLQSLHDWAVKEKSDYKATVETKANNSKNEYYTKCLSYEN